MFSLILKDVLLQKRNLIFGAFYIIIMVISFQETETSMISASIIALTYIMTQLACAYDEKANADILLNSLPISRRQIVTAKYVSAFSFFIFAIVYYMAIAGLLKVFGITFVRIYMVSIEGIVGALFALILITGIYFPLYFKFGYTKSRFVNFALLFGIFFGLGGVLPKLTSDKNSEFKQSIYNAVNNLPDVYIIAAITVIMVLLLAVSYMLSLKFYREREF